MSPLYADKFSGHMPEGDPRTPLTAAGACTWPIVPAYRYLLESEDAYGLLTPLNHDGILVEKDSVGIAHDVCHWNMIRGPIPVLFAFLTKQAATDRLSYTWSITIVVSLCGTLLFHINLPRQKCNQDFPIGDIHCPGYFAGTGNSFRASQVVYDEFEPP